MRFLLEFDIEKRGNMWYNRSIQTYTSKGDAV